MMIGSDDEGTEDAIILNGVSKAFGNHLALERVSFTVPNGKFLAILGPSGCGKSTLLGVIAGYVPQDSGTVQLLGRPVTRDTPCERRGIGMVFQQPTLFPHFTVSENIAFPLRARNTPASLIRSKVAEAIELVGIGGLDQRLPDTLSGGQQQRVALARALVFGPRVVLLDEPLSALDRPTREMLQEEIRHLQRRTRATFVHVTHDREEAMAMADLIAVMADGHIVQRGAPEDLYGKPETEFVARFFGDCNILSGLVRTDRGAPETVTEAGVVLSRGAHPPGAKPGDRVSVILWPEMFTLDQSAPVESADRSSVLAQIVDLRYLGSTALLTVETPLGRLKVRQNRSGDHPSVPASGQGRLSWSPERARAVALGNAAASHG
jgi:ABC-type Fe3+/spermidine/putrescine transport system ATPase subunit